MSGIRRANEHGSDPPVLHHFHPHSPRHLAAYISTHRARSRFDRPGNGESDIFKPLLIDTRDFDDFLSNTKPKFSQFFRELAAVNKVDDWRRAVPRGFLDGGGSERARRNKETLIGSTYHRATEIANIAG